MKTAKKVKKYTQGGKGLTDISGDGKVTQKDFLMSIGAIPKGNKKVKKQKKGVKLNLKGKRK